MRTTLIIMGGFVLLGVAVFLAKWFGTGTQTIVAASRAFIVIWLAAALLNMWIGVSRAGYSVGEELPIFLIIFALPAGVALFLWWNSR